MLSFFDSHAHYNDSRFSEDRNELLTHLNQNAHVDYMMNVSYDMPSSLDTVALTREFPFVYGAVGIHPHDAKTADEKAYDTLRTLAKEEKIKAIGETGLDYYYDHSERSVQKREFANHLDLALECSLPVIIHERDATKDTLDILLAHKNWGVFHCFSGSVETARIVLNAGYYISLGGPVTFKNAVHAKEVATFVPADRLLIETDSPYLAPVPHRGQRNTSENLIHIASAIAALRGISVEEVAAITNRNARTLFQITSS